MNKPAQKTAVETYGEHIVDDDDGGGFRPMPAGGGASNAAEKDLDRADRAVVAVHIPLDETSELLGGTQWLVKRRKDPLATVWGRRGRPYALNAALWHGGSGNRTTERRAVLALRFLPTDLPSRARDSFDDHFPGLRGTLPAE